VFHLFGALAEFERNLIRERTQAGLSAARARGRMGGRKPKLKPAQVKTLRKMYESRQHTVKEICQVMGISRATLYEYLKDKESRAKERSKAVA
jgi:DNA invertase Pin-like site-specific DNA recombinase